MAWYDSLGAYINGAQTTIKNAKVLTDWEVEGVYDLDIITYPTFSGCPSAVTWVPLIQTRIAECLLAAQLHIVNNVENLDTKMLGACSQVGMNIPDIGATVTQMNGAAEDIAAGGWFTHVNEHFDDINFVWNPNNHTCQQLNDGLYHIWNDLGVVANQISLWVGLFDSLWTLLDAAREFLSIIANGLGCVGAMMDSMRTTEMIDLIGLTDSTAWNTTRDYVKDGLTMVNNAKTAESSFSAQLAHAQAAVDTELGLVSAFQDAVNPQEFNNIVTGRDDINLLNSPTWPG